MRELLCRAIGKDSRLEVVAQAADGEEALAATHRYSPDVISMDLMMPKSGGLQAIARIMAERPTPIVVVSSLSQSAEGIAALQAGALAVTAKPESVGSPSGQEALRKVVRYLRLMAEVRVLTRPLPKGTAPAGGPWALVPSPPGPGGASSTSSPSAPGMSLTSPEPGLRTSSPGLLGALPRPAAALSCVCIAASTGGPPALRRILQPLPADFPIPVVVVQHISEGFGDGLVEWLDGILPLRVQTARYGQIMQAGTVTFAPDKKHLELGTQGRFLLSEGRPIRSHRPSADPLFASAARVFGSSALGIVLTGMGQDGLDGAARLKAAGGTVVAQDEQSCVVYGMPRAIIDAGICDRVLSLDEIGELLLSLRE
jgi:two-component system chemotaxis response regulator CheB